MSFARHFHIAFFVFINLFPLLDLPLVQTVVFLLHHTYKFVLFKLLPRYFIHRCELRHGSLVSHHRKLVKPWMFEGFFGGYALVWV